MIPTHEIEKLPRYHYLCQKLRFDWRDQLPTGYQVRRFDQALLDDPTVVIPAVIHDWVSIEIRWGSIENFTNQGVSSCILHGNKVVTICQSDCYFDDQIDIGIFTLPEYRNKGLAAVATTVNVEAVFQKGFRKVGWHATQTILAPGKQMKRLVSSVISSITITSISSIKSITWLNWAGISSSEANIK